MMLLQIYKFAALSLAPLFDWILCYRARIGRADAARLDEYRGVSGRLRPEGPLIWVHAASVGEAQSALSLIDDLLGWRADVSVLVTTGTVTSAQLMAQKLPPRAFHQFYPLDRPDWVERFVSTWRPDYALWMESELWPNMLRAIKESGIPAALLNARLSVRSARRWSYFKESARALLASFDTVFAQTTRDGRAFERLGARDVRVSGNIKYSAAPLPCDEDDLTALRAAVAGRPVWLYASTHAGEEALACAVHRAIQERYPDVLTLIVPRHPERRQDIVEICSETGLCSRLRGGDKALPSGGDDIYIADTLGELGLFYRLAPIAVIGRSFSADGGGGHNPIEAAQLGAAVLSGAYVRYQQEIFDEMRSAGAALVLDHASDLAPTLMMLLGDSQALSRLQADGAAFVAAKGGILHQVEAALWPMIDRALTQEEAA